MLVIYNESKKPWSVESISERRMVVSKSVTFTKKTDPNRQLKKTVGIHMDARVNPKEDIESYVLMKGDQPVTLSDVHTNILFQDKDCRPYVTANHKFEKDILLLTIRLEGGYIESITTNNIFVLNNYIANGEFTAVLSIGGDKKPDLEISVFHKDSAMRKIYTFHRSENTNEYDLAVVEEEVQESVPMKKLVNFRPLKPTHLIFVRSKDLGEFNKTTKKYQDQHKVVKFTDIDDLDNVRIQEVLDEHYKAATIYCNHKDKSDECKEIFKDAVQSLKKNFRVVNILHSDDTIEKL